MSTLQPLSKIYSQGKNGYYLHTLHVLVVSLKATITVIVTAIIMFLTPSLYWRALGYQYYVPASCNYPTTLVCHSFQQFLHVSGFRANSWVAAFCQWNFVNDLILNLTAALPQIKNWRLTSMGSGIQSCLNATFRGTLNFNLPKRE